MKSMSDAYYANLQEAWNPNQYTDPSSTSYMPPGPLRDETIAVAKDVYTMSLEEFKKRSDGG